MTPETIRFLLNGRGIETRLPSATLVLDFLRRRPGLTGTKEGCREGDCGACAVWVGERADDGSVRYRPVTSCLLPLAELHGKHLVTVEGLDVGRPSPVQSRIVEAGASQCGFCTPGIVVSLTAMALEEPGSPTFVPDGIDPDLARVERALSGHLCRCTGYRSLRDAGVEILRRVGRGRSVDELVEEGLLPSYFLEAGERLAEMPPYVAPAPGTEPVDEGEPPVAVAGGTDLYVQQGDRLPLRPVRVLGLDSLDGVERIGDRLEIGAGTSFEGLGESAEFRRLVPEIDRYMHWIASLQVRHRATVGGNLVNASPIGDVTVLMLALGARVRCRRPDGAERELELHRLYRGYKDLDLEPGEILTHVLLDVGAIEGTTVDFQKVSKRKCLDIATVNSAARIRLEDGRITELALATGGVAPVPLYLAEASALGVGRVLDADTVRELVRAAGRSIAPIDDVRGSADYKRALCGRLLIAHFLDRCSGVFTPSAEELETLLAEADHGSPGR